MDLFEVCGKQANSRAKNAENDESHKKYVKLRKCCEPPGTQLFFICDRRVEHQLNDCGLPPR